MNQTSTPTPMYLPSGLTRYGSAPGSLLNSIADSVINSTSSSSPSLIGSGSRSESGNNTHHPMTRFFTGGGDQNNEESLSSGGRRGDGGSHNNLMRHNSMPSGFFSHLMLDNGFSVSRGMGHYSQPANSGIHTLPSSRLKSQLSFSRQEPLSQISEISIAEMGESVVGGSSSDEAGGNVGQSYISNNYSWDETNSIAFSTSSGKRARDSCDDLLSCFSNIDSQFSLPTTSLEMATVEKLLQAQQDSVAFKVRAKRGCATHPRSIAERERRTRISEKLHKLQDLVPNMDKQTSTADMLDLAVQHIKELQSQVQTLNRERANCTCTCMQGRELAEKSSCV